MQRYRVSLLCLLQESHLAVWTLTSMKLVWSRGETLVGGGGIDVAGGWELNVEGLLRLNVCIFLVIMRR